MKKSLTKRDILRKRGDIKQVFKTGQSALVAGMKLFFLKNGLPYNRFLATCAKRYGNAVERNRAKRLVKEVYRNLPRETEKGWDVIFVLYPGKTRKADKFLTRKKQIVYLLGRIPDLKINL